jgi:hypothetical protein
MENKEKVFLTLTNILNTNFSTWEVEIVQEQLKTLRGKEKKYLQCVITKEKYNCEDDSNMKIGSLHWLPEEKFSFSEENLEKDLEKIKKKCIETLEIFLRLDNRGIEGAKNYIKEMEKEIEKYKQEIEKLSN